MCVCTVLFCIFLCTWVESDELRAPPALRSVSVLFSRQAARADLNNWFINQQKYFKFMTGLNMRRVFLLSEYTKTVKKASEKSDKYFKFKWKIFLSKLRREFFMQQSDGLSLILCCLPFLICTLTLKFTFLVIFFRLLCLFKMKSAGSTVL